MFNRDDLDKYYNHISQNLFEYDNLDFVKFFRENYHTGTNKFYQKNISETKKFDDNWIKVLESHLPSIDKIIKNPRSFIKYDEDVVAIDKAKNPGQRSFQHLASHTQYLRDVKKEDVIPSKILVETPEQDFNVYENRFIYTLIKRLFLFVKNRAAIISENVESFQKDHVAIDSDFDLDDSNVTMHIDLCIKRDLDNKKINEHNYDLLERVNKLNLLITGLYQSKFMKMMKSFPIVRPPIQKTNVILKNPDFKNAYNLWIFLDRYSTMDYDVDIREKNLKFDSDFQREMEDLVLLNTSVILGNQIERDYLFNITENDKAKVLKKNTMLTQNASDVVENPKSLHIEDTTLNEYFLKKYKELFKQSVEEIRENNRVTDEQAMKKALRKATDIVNGLYESIFKFEENKDIFHSLIREDIDRDYRDAMNKLKYAKVIREIKETDYKNAILREKRLLTNLEQINNNYIKSKSNQIKETIREEKISRLEDEILNYKEQIKKLSKQIAKLDDEKNLFEFEKNAINQSNKTVSNKCKEELKVIKSKYTAEANDLKVKYTKELKDLKQQFSKDKTKKQKLSSVRVNQVLKKLDIEASRVSKEYDLIKKQEEEKQQQKLEKMQNEYLKAKEDLTNKAKNDEEKIIQAEKEKIALAKVLAYEKKNKKVNQNGEEKAK